MSKKFFDNWSIEKKREALQSLLAEFDETQRKIFEEENAEPVTIADSLIDLKANSDKKTEFRWPFPTLQKALGGIWPAEMYTIGGGTGMGKSLFGAYISLETALQGGKVLYLSTEMPHTEITRRIWKMWENYEGGEEFFNQLPITFTDPKIHISVPLIEMMLEKNKRLVPEGMAQDYKLVVVDNLHWFSRGGASVSEDIGLVTRGIKELSMKYGVAVLLVSHLNRQVGDGPAELHHLKGSSYIEQDSDAVMMIYRDKKGENLPKNQLLFSLLKNRRNGITFDDVLIASTPNLTLREMSYYAPKTA